MLGIDFSEILFILVVVLLLFGPKKIPEFARGLAKIIAQVKNATNDIKNEITKTVNTEELANEIKNTGESIKKQMGYDDLKQSLNTDTFNPIADVEKEIKQTQEDLENMTGPIKRLR